jgi:hypothetical protein
MFIITPYCYSNQNTNQDLKDSAKEKILVNALVAIMTDVNASWDARCQAEDSLIKQKPEEVLLILLNHLEKGMPDGGIWNSASRDDDKDAPVEWQIYYAVLRSWDNQVNFLPKPSGGYLLLKLLEKAKTGFAREYILKNIYHRWIPEAEKEVVKIMEDPNEGIIARTIAARDLMLKGKNDYHERFLFFADSNNFENQKRWLNLLANVLYKKKTGIDPRVIKLGFELIIKERESNPNYNTAGYFLAITTGRYINLNFQPDQKEPQYQEQHGLSDKFFSDTVDNALAWWSKNKEAIEKELLIKYGAKN